jgi:hypothetical protein
MKKVLDGVDGLHVHVPITSMNRLNQTEPFILYFAFWGRCLGTCIQFLFTLNVIPTKQNQ